MPGVITCPGVGEGDAVGICMSGVITCGGLGEGEGLVMAGLLVEVRRAFGRGLFLGAVLGLAFAAGFFFMSCISCCGRPVTLSPNTKAHTTNIRSPLLQLNPFMISPFAPAIAKSDGL